MTAQIAERTRIASWVEVDAGGAEELLTLLRGPTERMPAEDAERALPIDGLILQLNVGGRDVPTAVLDVAAAVRTLGLWFGLAYKCAPARTGGLHGFARAEWVEEAVFRLHPRTLICEAETWTKLHPGPAGRIGQEYVTSEGVDAILDDAEMVLETAGLPAGECERIFWPATYQWHPSFAGCQRVVQRGWTRLNYLCDVVELSRRMANGLSPWKTDAHSAVHPRGLNLAQVGVLVAVHNCRVLHYGLAGAREALRA